MHMVFMGLLLRHMYVRVGFCWFVFFFKQKTAYELRISDWSSDVCSSDLDYYALGLYRALRERGIRIPDDVLVMGWGNHPFTRFMEPPLSTLLLPFEEVARRATRRLLDRIQGKADDRVVNDHIVPELVLCASRMRRLFATAAPEPPDQ